jgi:hypothetical protein
MSLDLEIKLYASCPSVGSRPRPTKLSLQLLFADGKPPAVLLSLSSLQPLSPW